MTSELTLLQAPIGAELTMLRAQGEPALCRRMAALGLRRGAKLAVVQRTAGGGRTVSVAGSRIALDRELASRLFAEVVA